MDKYNETDHKEYFDTNKCEVRTKYFDTRYPSIFEYPTFTQIFQNSNRIDALFFLVPFGVTLFLSRNWKNRSVYFGMATFYGLLNAGIRSQFRLVGILENSKDIEYWNNKQKN